MSSLHGSILGVALALTACGPSPGGSGPDGATGTGGEVSSSSSSGDVAADETATTGDAPVLCQASRHPLLEELPCGRIGVGDLDADGIEDVLALPNGSSFISHVVDRLVHTYPGGELPLAAPQLHCCVEMGSPYDLVLPDINADGRQDPVFVIDHESVRGDVVSPIVVLEGLVSGPASGYLGHRRLVNAGTVSPVPRVAAGDFISGTPTIVVSTGSGTGGRVTSSVGLWRADGLNWMSPAPEMLVTFEESVRALAATDVSGNGQDDAIVVLESSFQVLHSPGDGSLVPAQVTPPPALHHTVAVGDLDGQGAPDIVLAGPDGVVVGLVTVAQLIWLPPQPAPAVPNPWTLMDFDGDGTLDLVTTDADQVLAYAGLGDGTLATEAQVLSVGVGSEVLDLAAGDLDGDGRDEVVVCDDLGLLVVSSDSP